MTTHAIAVIGAGASGTLLALHLLRRAPPGTRVTLIDRNAPFGPGLAYATGSENHLLNVPAGRMSAFVDQPRHFVDWLERQSAQLLGGVQPTEASFVPRRLYGAYLRHLLNREMQNPALDLVHDHVTAIDGAVLRLASGRTISADLVVLATGNDRPASPCHAPAVWASPCWRSDPWAPNAFSTLDTNASVLLIGTGLTMVDAVITLLDQGHVGPIHAVSRRGLLPRPHGSGAPEPPPQRKLPAELRELTRMVRRQTAASGDAWRGAIDGMRPFTQEIWRSLSVEDRRRFLRHLRPWWDVHRHRMPPSVAAQIDAARTSGQLRIYAGRIAGFASSEHGMDVQLRLRDGRPNTLLVARAVNCSGPCTDVTRSDDPLLRALLRDGLARPDDCRLGLDATTAGALRGRDGTVSQTLFAHGPLSRGALWEITAIPEIRRQCEVLALHLSELLREQARQRHRTLAYA
jgi:uncharacterized NAD(P)/FAD-binding protein YdhS